MKFGTTPPVINYWKSKQYFANQHKKSFKEEEISFTGSHKFLDPFPHICYGVSTETSEERWRRIKEDALSELIPRSDYYKKPIINHNKTTLSAASTAHLYHKKQLNITIVEDIKDVREKIKNILPGLLWEDFDVRFEEFDNLEEAKNYLRDFVQEIIYWDEILLLDNTFPVNKDYWLTREASKSGTNLYDFLWTNLDEFYLWKLRENIAIISGLKPEILERKYEWIDINNIIPWKDKNFDEFIEKVNNWVKERYKKNNS